MIHCTCNIQHLKGLEFKKEIEIGPIPYRLYESKLLSFLVFVNVNCSRATSLLSKFNSRSPIYSHNINKSLYIPKVTAGRCNNFYL